MESNLDQTLQQAVVAHNQGKLQEAERLYHLILQSRPQHALTNHNLGVLVSSSQNVTSAIPLFKTALEANPDVEQFWLSYIDALLKVDQIKKAKQLIKKAKKAGFSATVLADLEAMLKKSKRNTNICVPSSAELERLINSYQQGNFDLAFKIAQKLADAFPSHPLSFKVLGALFVQMGDYEKALVANQKATMLAPNDAQAHNSLGVTLHEIGKVEQAEASYRQAIKLMPNYAEAYNNLGNALQEFGQLEQAKNACKQAISLFPDYAQAYYNLGIILNELNEPIQAKESYSKAISNHPNYPEALLNRGQILFEQSHFAEALKDFDLCDTPDARARALICLYKLGKLNDIFERLETHCQRDTFNLRIAAFAAFIAEKTQQITANNFCNKPLEFLHFSNLVKHVPNPAHFIEGAIQEINQVETTWEPKNKTTRNGFQSSVDLFATNLATVKMLKDIIISELEDYYARFKGELCTFMQQWPEHKKLTAWHVVLKQSGHQEAHIHPDGWLSGVIYLKVVPSLDKSEGAIAFSLNGEFYDDDNIKSKTFQPKTGDIVFFPSSLHHKTLPFSTNTDRIIISFDLKPALQ